MRLNSLFLLVWDAVHDVCYIIIIIIIISVLFFLVYSFMLLC